MKKIKLYIAKEGDTVSLIAGRFSTDEGEIIRYNPSLRYKKIYKGQPLNVPFEEYVEKPVEEISHEVLTLRKKSDDAVTTSADKTPLVKYSYALRDALMMKALYKQGVRPFFQEIEDAAEEWMKKSTSKLSKKVGSFLVGFADSISAFAESLYAKDIVGIKENLYKLKAEEIKTGDDDKTTSFRSLISSFIEIWRDLVIAIAELDFNKITQKFKESLRTLDNVLESGD